MISFTDSCVRLSLAGGLDLMTSLARFAICTLVSFKAKDEAGNHRSSLLHSRSLCLAVKQTTIQVSDGTLTADLRHPKLRILQSRFPMWFVVTRLFFVLLTRQSFHRIWKNNVYEESCRTLSCFWKVSIMIGKMIVNIPRCLSWLGQPTVLQNVRLHYRFFLKKRPEQFTCFLSIDIFDVIISFNVVFQIYPWLLIVTVFELFCDEFKILKCCTETLSLLSLPFLPQHKSNKNVEPISCSK